MSGLKWMHHHLERIGSFLHLFCVCVSRKLENGARLRWSITGLGMMTSHFCIPEATWPYPHHHHHNQQSHWQAVQDKGVIRKYFHHHHHNHHHLLRNSWIYDHHHDQQPHWQAVQEKGWLRNSYQQTEAVQGPSSSSYVHICPAQFWLTRLYVTF